LEQKDAPIVNEVYDKDRGWVRLHVGSAFWEQLDWDPVRVALVELGALPQAVTMQANMPAGQGKFQSYTGLYMWGFMDWASSQDALARLLDGVPKNAKGVEAASKRQSRRKLTDSGWTGVDPFNPVMMPQ
jgi:hypothetical protein